MSAKIYKGFRLNTDSFAEALRRVNAFRPWVNTQAEGVIDAFMKLAKDCNKPPDADAYLLWLELQQKLLREKKRRAPNIDTDFSVTLIPAAGVVLGVAYTEHQDWYEAWCRQPGVEEYAYWNNADQPQHVSDAEWAVRAQAWDVLSGDPVCVQGFSIDLVDPEGPLPKQFRIDPKQPA